MDSWAGNGVAGLSEGEPGFFEANNQPVEQRMAVALEKVAQALRHHAWREGTRDGVTPAQGQILAFLRQHQGATLGEVAATLGLRAATASEMVRTLEQKKLVSKSRRLDDARALELHLTASGKKLASRTIQWLDLLADVVSDLSREERSVFLRAILGLIRGMQKNGYIQQVRMCLTCQYFKPYAHDDEQRPHHCLLVDEAFGDLDLRVECPDQVSASEEKAKISWKVFANGKRRLS